MAYGFMEKYISILRKINNKNNNDNNNNNRTQL
jgi:hypothetical protein